MMEGRVNQNCEATLSIVVRSNTTTQLIDAVIDTGFSGFLTLPSEIISTLRLSWEGRDFATLGDGSSCYVRGLSWVCHLEWAVPRNLYQRVRDSSSNWNAIITRLRITDSNH